MLTDRGEDLHTFYIGIDLGTSGAEGVLVDEQGTIFRRSKTSYQSTYPQLGHVEQDPERDWWRAVREISAELLTPGPPKSIGAVSVTGLGPCVVVADEQGRTLRPAILYGVDTRSTAQIKQLSTELEVGECVLTTQAVGPKLMWIQQNEPDVWARTAKIFTSHSYVAHRLSGAYFIDRVSAELWEPLSDGSGGWLPAIASKVARGVELPAVVEANAQVGVVCEEAARETGIPVGTPVVAGTIDFAAEVVGAGAEQPGDCVVVYGSTLSINVVVEGGEVAPGLLTSAGVVAGTRYVGGVTSASGALLKWLSALVGESSLEALTEKAQQIAPGSDGVTVIPHLAGERSPGFNAAASCAITGLRLEHDTSQVFRAALEAIAYSARQILHPTIEAIGMPKRIIAVGGGTANTLLLQLVSDVVGIAQQVSPNHSGAAYGAAILAAKSCGCNTSVWHERTPTNLITPNSKRLEIYTKQYSNYLLIDAALQNVARDQTVYESKESSNV